MTVAELSAEILLQNLISTDWVIITIGLLIGDYNHDVSYIIISSNFCVMLVEVDYAKS